MNFNTLNKQRKFMAIASFIGLVAIFLPWVSASTFLGKINANGLDFTSGYFVLMGFAGVLTIALLGKHEEQLETRFWILALISSATALLSTLVSFLNINTGGIGSFASVSYGVGIFVALAAAVGTVAATWMLKKPGDTLQSGFAALKDEAETATNAPTQAPPAAPSKVDELAKLANLKAEGKITEAEYEEMKAKIL